MVKFDMSKNNYIYFSSITALAGKGGNGCISFIRSSHMPKGGPDGGDGGRGGSVYIIGDSGTLTLSEFRRKRDFKAGNGGDGSSSNKTGKNGDNTFIKVPVGSQIWCDNEMLIDVSEADMPYLLAQGGEGGLGNMHFATPDMTTPYIATNGEPGEHIIGEIHLKYFADVGLIGLPNVGKSTFVKQISNAKVNIGDYPFSTIEPIIGICTHKEHRFVVADLPGLLEGAHADVGLGHQFLQHLERCKVLLHFVDAGDIDGLKNFNIITNEIRIFNPDILQKQLIVVLSRVDLADPEVLEHNLKAFENSNPILLSEHDPDSINNLLDRIITAINTDRTTST